MQEFALLDQGRIQSWWQAAGVTAIGYRDVLRLGGAGIQRL
jgi:hypothetical protein